MKITFVILHAYGMGGTIRATINLANELAERHEVEILSVLRRADAAFFPISPKVRVRSLVDGPGYGPATPRRRLRDILHRLPSLLVHPQDRASRSFSPLTDVALIRALRGLDSDVVIATRAGLNLVVARYAPRRVVRVAQEHLFLAVHRPDILERIRRDYRRLDGVVTLTEADRDDYRRLLGEARTRVDVIGNGLPESESGRRADPSARVVVSAGRFSPVKGFDRLIDAYAKLAPGHPDWQLWIYGAGRLQAELRARIDELGLAGQIKLKPRTPDMASALANGSIAAVASRFEGFGMTVIEAFGVGLPVVSFDCPRGPREIITNGHDGLLVPDDDISAFAGALSRLMDDEELRRTLGEAAQASAHRYGIHAVAAQWEQALTDLLTTRRVA